MAEVKIEGGVARIFLNRPQKVNALDSALLASLLDAVQNLAEDVRVVVLAGREPEALKLQKQLLQLWEEAPLAAPIRTSIDLFSRSYAPGIPASRMR